MNRNRSAVCLWLVLAIGAMAPSAAGYVEEAHKDAMGREYYVYLPKEIDPERTYWLVVGAHTAGGTGKGASGMNRWVDKGNVIAVGPTFPSGFQWLGKNSGKQLIEIFKRLHKKYKLHGKMFLYGFSAGSQFTHRFAMKYPDLVAGCASHSGGSWGRVNRKARGVAFAVSSGEKDTSRLEGALRFFRDLDRGGFYFKARIWPDAGHGVAAGGRQITEECFVLATTGMVPRQRQAVDDEFAAIDGLIADEEYAQAIQRLRSLCSGRMPKPAKKLDDDGKRKKFPTKWKSKKENAYGWRESKAGRSIFGKRAKEHIEGEAAPKLAGIEDVGLAKVTEIQKGPPEDADEKLAELRKQFKGAPKTTRAIAELTRKLAMTPTPVIGPTSPSPSTPSTTRPTPPDPKPGQPDAQKQAASKLGLAESYLAAGMRARAIEILKTILSDYPTTEAAVRARVKLQGLGPG